MKRSREPSPCQKTRQPDQSVSHCSAQSQQHDDWKRGIGQIRNPRNLRPAPGQKLHQPDSGESSSHDQREDEFNHRAPAPEVRLATGKGKGPGRATATGRSNNSCNSWGGTMILAGVGTSMKATIRSSNASRWQRHVTHLLVMRSPERRTNGRAGMPFGQPASRLPTFAGPAI